MMHLCSAHCSVSARARTRACAYATVTKVRRLSVCACACAFAHAHSHVGVCVRACHILGGWVSAYDAAVQRCNRARAARNTRQCKRCSAMHFKCNGKIQSTPGGMQRSLLRHGDSRASPPMWTYPRRCLCPQPPLAPGLQLGYPEYPRGILECPQSPESPE